MKELALHNAQKAKDKAKNIKGNTFVDSKRIAKIAKKETQKSKDIVDSKLVDRSNWNFRVCKETPGLVGKIDYIVWEDEDDVKLMVNTITKVKARLHEETGLWLSLD